VLGISGREGTSARRNASPSGDGGCLVEPWQDRQDDDVDVGAMFNMSYGR